MKKILAVMLGIAMITAPSLAAAQESVSLTGAGASFPYPLYSKWISVYQKQNPGVMINYQSIGSGGGIKQISAKTVDFGATDAPMKDKALAKAKGRIFHLPMTMGAVAVGYNLPGVTSLKLTQKALVGIYLGKIKKWNDPEIQAANEGINLPDAPVMVVHRSEGSGTTSIFTDFLSKISLEWKAKVGKGKSVAWPTGIGAKGNEGVSGVVARTPFTIGYMNLAYCVQNNIPYTAVENKSGNFVEPSAEGVSNSVAGVKIPGDTRVSIVNSSNPEAYPISGFTWILIYKKIKDPVKGQALVNFLRWCVTEGQKYCEPLHYAPIPSSIVKMNEEKLSKVVY